MRASVTAPFHDPITGALIARGTVLTDSGLTWLPDHPDLAHNLAFTDRTPGDGPVVPAAPVPAFVHPPEVKE